MNISEAISSRRSIRAFKPDPVPEAVLKEIMSRALQAPSFGNLQPWEFAIVTGKTLDTIKNGFLEATAKQCAELPIPARLPEPYQHRHQLVSRELLEIQGIHSYNREVYQRWDAEGHKLYNAPSAIYLFTDRACYNSVEPYNAWSIFDCGIIAGMIDLLALEHKLGTIQLVQAVVFPEVIRKTLGLSDSKLIIEGIAIGYPDWDNPLNKFRSPREPVEKLVSWYGF